MPSDLATHVAETTVIDTHEHLEKEHTWVQRGPGDVLADLFASYVKSDLISAGASAEAVKRLTDATDPDVERRWADVEPAWHAIQHTGYGESVRRLAKDIYGIEHIAAEALRSAAPRLQALSRSGQRLTLLRDHAKIDHVQTDDKTCVCEPDLSGPDFFLYDLSWVGFCARGIDFNGVAEETGIYVKDLATLRRAMEVIFERYAPVAIAVKSQHAYNRTLRWTPASDADAERDLQSVLSGTSAADDVVPIALGNWSLAQGAQLAGEYELPFKIHTGYYAGNGKMQVDRIHSGHLDGLLGHYPNTRFVLMHIAYPYSDELIAMVKHFPNAYADLCWAWSISPRSSREFVRRFLHTAPVNKLFAFGGDTQWPTAAYAYCLQMRDHLTRTLQEEVTEGDLTEAEAIGVATRLMVENQRACFDIDGTRSSIQQTAAVV